MSPLHVLGQHPWERCPGCDEFLSKGELVLRVRGIAFHPECGIDRSLQAMSTTRFFERDADRSQERA